MASSAAVGPSRSGISGRWSRFLGYTWMELALLLPTPRSWRRWPQRATTKRRSSRWCRHAGTSAAPWHRGRARLPTVIASEAKQSHACIGAISPRDCFASLAMTALAGSEPSRSQHWKCQGAPEGQTMMKTTLFAALLMLLPVCARAQAPTRCIPAVMSLSGEGESDVAVLDMRGQWHVSSWGGVTWIALHAPDEKARCLARQLLLGASKVRSDTADTRCTGDWGKFMRIVSADPLVHACQAAPSCSVGDLCS